MGISQIQDQFYEKVHPYKSGNVQNLSFGQIAWVPTPFLDKNMIIIEKERANREDHDNIKFKLTRLNSNHFINNDNQLPIPNLKLNPTEELMAFKAKKRPCVFMGKADLNLSEADIKKLTQSKKYLLTSDYLFLPIYSTHLSDYQKGFPVEFVNRVKHFLYSHLVYLPNCNLKGTETIYPPKEGIIRLDRLFITCPIVPNVSPTDVKLDDSYFKILQLHLKEYLFRETAEPLKELRELLEEAYSDYYPDNS